MSRSLTQHSLGFQTYGVYLLIGLVHRHDGRLVEDDAVSFQEYERVRGPEVDSDVVG